jgi:hypothetical protein
VYICRATPNNELNNEFGLNREPVAAETYLTDQALTEGEEAGYSSFVVW